MLVSMVAGSRKKSEQLASEVSKLLKQKGKKASIIRIVNNLAPDFTKSPYIASLYDINSRYNQKYLVNSKLKNDDYVIVLGYSAETMAREIFKFASQEERLKFCDWLENIEQNPYELPLADKVFLISDDTNDAVHALKKLRDSSVLLPPKKAANDIVTSLLAKPSSTKKSNNKTRYSLYNVLEQYALGNRIDFSLSDQAHDPKLNELISANKLIAKRLNSTLDYIVKITQPLNAPVIINAHIKTAKMHNSGLLKTVEALSSSNHHSLDQSTKIKFNPANEIELSDKIAANNGLEKTDIKYTQRMRLIETWALALAQNDHLAQLSTLEASGVLSMYDFLSLADQLTSLKAAWQPLNAVNGYVDCTAPESIENLVQDTFDNSILFSSNEKNNPAKYLLMGHKTKFYLTFNWHDLLKIYKNEPIKGSELLNAFIKTLKDSFEEKFPIVVESLK